MVDAVGPNMIGLSNGDWIITEESMPFRAISGGYPVVRDGSLTEMREREGREQERQASHLASHLARRQKMSEAEGRANKLLLSLLTRAQRKDYKRSRSFVVVGSLGNQYRIDEGSTGNVLWFDDGGRIANLCCAPNAYPDGLRISNTFRYEMPLPESDFHIGQMLALKTDERHFLKNANVFTIYRKEFFPNDFFPHVYPAAW